MKKLNKTFRRKSMTIEEMACNCECVSNSCNCKCMDATVSVGNISSTFYAMNSNLLVLAAAFLGA